MRKGTPTFRILFVGVLILACLGVLIGRLWWIQVVRGDYYLAKVKGGSRVTVRIPAVRGEIRDRNGIPLVENRRSFEVDFYLPDIVNAYKKEHGKPPMREVMHRRTDRLGNVSEVQEMDIAQMVNETIIPKLQSLALEKDYNSEQLQVHFRNDTLIPFAYQQDLDFETMARMLENNVALPGLKAEVKPVRHYPFGAMAAHILGYVGAPRDINAQRAAEAAEGRKYNFYQPDLEGRSQIEKAMDKWLRGTPGVRILQRDAKNKLLEDGAELVPPVPGANVYLTLDARLQYIVEDTLRVCGRAAAVVVDVNNGDILAMASVPSYDPNSFVPSVDPKIWAELTNDETSPLLNRAINGYIPGSTYKILTSLAIERAGIGTRRFNCGGGVAYGNTFMKCWIHGKGTHGALEIEGGIKNSCNGYYYQAANVAGIKQIEEIGGLLGFGQLSGIPLDGESPGILDGPAYLTQIAPNDRWRPSYTANVSIGQGRVLATPLQLAMMTATVANGGTCYYPRLVDRVVAQDGSVLEQEPARVRSNLISDAGMTAEQIEHVRHGMWRVVNEAGGTAGKARIKGMEVSGKTGTAQNWRVNAQGQRVSDNNVLFIAFAPYDKPKYAVCVMVNGGKSGGGVAAPIAAKILEEANKLEKGETEVQLAALTPAPGNFKFIESIDFDREVPGAVSAEETSETAPAAQTVVRETSRSSETPNIRAEPDRRGRVEQPPERKRGLLERFFNPGGKRKPKPEPAPQRERKPGWNPFRR